MRISFRTATVGALALAMLSTLVPPAAAAVSTGWLDRTFGGDGKVLTNVGGDDTGEAVAVQADGKIVVAGTAHGGTDIALVRYNTDGSLDSTFGGGDGKVITDVSGDDAAFAVAIQPDQKILVGGFADGTLEAALLRYDTTGTLDPTFGGGDGIALTTVGQGALFTDLVVQPDDAILAGGTMTPDGVKGEYLVVRYDSSGVPDATFGGGDGIQTTIVGTGGGFAEGIALQADGSIVLAGTQVSSSNENVELVRYDSSGSLDTTFGAAASGKVTTDVGAGPDEGTDVAIQTDGKIVVAANSNFRKGAVLRYDTDGTLDPTFSGDGKVLTKLGQFGQAYGGLVLQPDDAIVAVGEAVEQTQFSYTDTIVVARYTTTGVLDTTFSRDGKAFAPFGAGSGNGAPVAGNDVAVQGDGKIVAVGTAPGAGGGSDVAAARFGTKATAVLPRPDLLIRSGGSFVGDGRYNVTGLGQTIAKKVARGHSASFSIKIQNDGNTVDTIMIQGSGGAPGVGVQYFANGAPVTRRVLFGGFHVVLAPGASATIKLIVHVSTSAKVGKVFRLPVGGTSEVDFTKQDVVAAKIRIT